MREHKPANYRMRDFIPVGGIFGYTNRNKQEKTTGTNPDSTGIAHLFIMQTAEFIYLADLIHKGLERIF